MSNDESRTNKQRACRASSCLGPSEGEFEWSLGAGRGCEDSLCAVGSSFVRVAKREAHVMRVWSRRDASFVHCPTRSAKTPCTLNAGPEILFQGNKILGVDTILPTDFAHVRDSRHHARQLNSTPGPTKTTIYYLGALYTGKQWRAIVIQPAYPRHTETSGFEKTHCTL